MLLENLAVASGTLNLGVETAINITDQSYIDTESETRYYRPKKIKYTNSSGNTVSFTFFSDKEHTAWLARTVKHDMYSVINSATETLECFAGDETTKIVVSGVIDGHTGPMNFVVFKA